VTARLVGLGSLVAILAATAVPTPARAELVCVGSVSDLLKKADVAFVGTIVSIEPVNGHGIPQYAYRFKVEKAAKGQLGAFATVRAAKLVDCNLRPLTADTKDAVGVLATRTNGEFVTSEQGLVDPGSLLGAADAPKGGGIKVAIGLVLAAIVVAFSVHRLRKRGGDPPPNPLR
jgi:hypothetical protein